MEAKELKIEKSVCDCGSTDVKIEEYGFYKCNDCNNEWVVMKTKSKTL